MIICEKDIGITINVTLSKNYIDFGEESFAIEIVQSDGLRQMLRDSEFTFNNFITPTIEDDGSFDFTITPTKDGVFRVNILLDNDSDNKTVKTIATIGFNVVTPVTSTEYRI